MLRRGVGNRRARFFQRRDRVSARPRNPGRRRKNRQCGSGRATRPQTRRIRTAIRKICSLLFRPHLPRRSGACSACTARCDERTGLLTYGITGPIHFDNGTLPLPGGAAQRSFVSGREARSRATCATSPGVLGEARREDCHVVVGL